jgi:protein-tyrosine-phosphatase/predicted ATP-grasp superfamily ATP-dependent carboligase
VLKKSLTVVAAQRSGIPVPDSYHIAALSDLEAQREKLSFPVVAKASSKLGFHSTGVRYFRNFEELRQAFHSDPEFGRRLLFQEYCPGVGIGLEVLFHNRKAIAVFQHRRLKELPRTGGVSVLAVSEAPDPLLVHYSTALLSSLDWEGVAMVEFRYDRSRKTAKLMEVNGRYWGSLSLSCMAGMDFPFYHWQIVHSQRPDVPARYKIGLRMRWTRGEIRRLFRAFTVNDNATQQTSRWNELSTFLLDLLPPTRDALWSVSDPVPALQDLSFPMSGGLKKLLRAVIPSRLLSFVYRCRRLGTSGALVYVNRRLARILPIRQKQFSRVSGRTSCILFVCYGNIIRSPMAAALLRRQLENIDSAHEIWIASAGTSAKPGGADPRACEVATEFGITLESHRTQPLTADVIRRADVIFVMDFLNEAELLGRYPEAAPKVFLLGENAQRLGSEPAEIKDPYNGDIADIRRCYHRLDGQIRTLATMLSSSR